ncbi:AprI/Inh family metalloprotease inhibitor [Pseudomonas sp. Marseille-Q5115]|uniref:AprI/Inh family metalloprotease inhibitor n=1 Tax=Pseudomonas sp. Marseille-Q5115 TaxID=2866593 RepID=UPI001CE44206|nr:AprI/Inh family metalloprotease inhibitor [Pseudomonas sp. Marseille-Q5115]
MSKARTGALLVTLMVGSALLPAAATSLAPANTQAVAGDWMLFPEGQPARGCRLHLTQDGQADSNGERCESQWLGAQTIASWASKPDGITLASRERRTLLMLTPIGPDRFRGRSRDGQVLWLERQ